LEITSKNATDSTNATYEGWAYRGFLAGIDIPSAIPGDRTLSGQFLSLYVDPDGNIGYLKGALAGEAYPALGLFAMSGGVYPEIKGQDTGIDPKDIGQSTWTWTESGALFGFSGNFEGEGSIATDSRSLFLALGALAVNESDSNFNSMGFINYKQNRAEPWGIFALSTMGTYDQPAGKTSWNGHIGGMGTFGAYDVSIEHTGTYSYPDGGTYDYTYYSDNSFGAVHYRRFVKEGDVIQSGTGQDVA
jgi:hypothetical protein